MNVLFLTAATGGGHIKAAQALMQQMERQIPDCGTKLVDSLKYINPLVDKLVTGTYLRTIRSVPAIYGKFYDLSEKNEGITDIVKGLSGILSGKLYDLLDSYKPDAVVCVHTMPLQMLSVLKEKGLLDIPVIGVVTDYTHHSFWKLGGVDAFIVANETVRRGMVGLGIREERVHAVGIPVTECFLSKADKDVVLGSLGLERKPTVLLMGGSLGFGGLEHVFSSLLRLPRELQIIVATGYNGRLGNRLRSLAEGTRKKVRILGYSDRIHELMDASDLLITKPGGITVSEALVKRLPLLLTTPIPGQEERNARFLVRSGAAVRLEPGCNPEPVLERVLGRPSVLKKMSDAAAKLAMPHACEDVAGLVEGLVTRKAALYCKKAGEISPDLAANGFI
jgi:processive 1,2-diacylglycerol beta-glucosyltransferase